LAKDEWWKHLDHELGQLIELQVAFHEPGFGERPELVRHSMDVAYGAAFRALLDFAHSGRPDKNEWKRLPDESKEDIWSANLLGTTLRPDWTEEELTRLRDADKLIGHLSADRVGREGSQREWGGPEDLKIWRDFVRAVVEANRNRLPRATLAWRALYPGPLKQRSWPPF
jgi:hypothetical protein